MKVRCPISGFEEYHGDLFRNEPVISSPHPIFSLNSRSLLARARKYSRRGYNDREKILLFLALLNRTELVDFEVAAIPSEALVDRNMQQALHLIGWFTEASPNLTRLPHYRVTENNQDLNNIAVFFNTLSNVREEWMKPQNKRLLQDLVEAREFKLHKIIHSIFSNKTASFYHNLASWTITVTSVPEHVRNEWEQIISTHPDDLNTILSLEPDSIESLYIWVLRELHATGSIGATTGFAIAQEAISHISRLANIRDKGMLGALDEEYKGAKNTFTVRMDLISQEDTETEILQLEEILEQAGVPESLPERASYEDRLSDWIRDKGLWLKHSGTREKLILARKSLENKVIVARLRQLETASDEEVLG